MKKILAAGLLAAPSLVLSAPASAQEADCAGLDRPVVLAGLDWDSNAFNNGVAGFILEHGYGCAIDVIPGSTIPLLNGMIRGDIDVTMEVWVPNVRDAWETAVADGSVASVGVSYRTPRRSGTCRATSSRGRTRPRRISSPCPTCRATSRCFADPEQPDKGRFYNCILGWGCEVMNTKEAHRLRPPRPLHELRPGTGGALAAAIESSILREQPIVFYYWGPTWVLGKVADDVVALEEPAYDEATWNALSDMDQAEVTPDTSATAYPTVEVEIGVNTDFEAEAPALVEFLGEYGLDAGIISEALAYMQDEGASAEEAARWWLANNEDTWRGWVPDAVAERVTTALGES